MSVAVTGLYAGILVVIFFVLSMRVINNRVRAQVNLLDGRDEALTRAMRAHGNFAEYVPFALLYQRALIRTHGPIFGVRST